MNFNIENVLIPGSQEFDWCFTGLSIVCLFIFFKLILELEYKLTIAFGNLENQLKERDAIIHKLQSVIRIKNKIEYDISVDKKKEDKKKEDTKCCYYLRKKIIKKNRYI